MSQKSSLMKTPQFVPWALTLDNAEAQWRLSPLYFTGRGVPQDFVIAHMWANLAAAQNGRDAVREITAGYMTPAQIAEAQKLARECLKREYKGCE